MADALTKSERRLAREDSADVQRRYDRIARVYDLLEGSMELLAFTRWRRLLWDRVGARPGRVLEVGVGTGKSTPLWPAGCDLTAIDLSERMLDRARRRAGDLGLSPRLEQMDVEALELPGDRFDVAVATFVFCSVEDLCAAFVSSGASADRWPPAPTRAQAFGVAARRARARRHRPALRRVVGRACQPADRTQRPHRRLPHRAVCYLTPAGDGAIHRGMAPGGSTNALAV